MLVRWHVAAAAVAVRAGVGVASVHGEGVVVDVAGVRVVEVAIVHIVEMVLMVEAAVAAVLPMLMGVLRMRVANLHPAYALGPRDR